MGYRPNPFVSAFTAQVMHHRRSPDGAVIAVLDCSPVKERNSRLYLRGALQRADALGFTTELFHLRDLNFSLSRLNGILHARSIHAALVLPVPPDFDLGGFNFEQMAVATVDPTLHSPILHRASPDYFQGMKLAISTLEKRGYERIAFCSLSQELDAFGEEWLGAYTGWQTSQPARRRLPPCIDHLDPKKFANWMERHQPDALISNVERYFEMSTECGRNPPDIAYVKLAAGSHKPEYAGIDQRHVQIGESAIDIIVTQIHHNEYGLPQIPKTLMIHGAWMEGDSVRPLPTK